MNHLKILFITLISLNFFAGLSRAKTNKTPFIEESETERKLIIPDDLADSLEVEYPGYRIPAEADFDPEMLKYYFSQLIGVHPAIAWGDFNEDKKLDYALLIITGQTPWGPQVELVIMNGLKKKGDYDPVSLGEIYQFKTDYLRSRADKLYKGKLKRGGWYINWDKTSKEYKIKKS